MILTQPGQGAGKVIVAFPSEAVIVLFSPSVELPVIVVPVGREGGAVNVSVTVIVLDEFDVAVDDFVPLEVGNAPVMFVSLVVGRELLLVLSTRKGSECPYLKFCEKATFFESEDTKRIRLNAPLVSVIDLMVLLERVRTTYCCLAQPWSPR